MCNNILDTSRQTSRRAYPSTWPTTALNDCVCFSDGNDLDIWHKTSVGQFDTPAYLYSHGRSLAIIASQTGIRWYRPPMQSCYHKPSTRTPTPPINGPRKVLYEQTVVVADAVLLNDIRQLLRLEREIERVRILHLIAHSVTISVSCCHQAKSKIQYRHTSADPEMCPSSPCT